MNRLQGASSVKRKQPELPAVSDSLTGNDLVLYNLIHSKKDMAIWIADMRKETNLSHSDVEKSLQSLVSKTLIEQVVNIHNKGRKHYMATEFKPSNEITGGDWYNKKGSFDTGFINLLQDRCFRYIFNQKVSTLDGVLEWSRSGVFSIQVKTEQIQEILKTLLLDDKILEVTSTGSGDFAFVPKGRICYKCKSKGGVIEEQKHAAFTDIPCGVCPRINVCTIDGIVSPTTCVYYQKWLDF